MNELERRIIDISYRKHIAHIGSCITAVNLIEEIYNVRKPDEPFVLSNGHAGLALYAVLEKHGFGNAEEIFDKHGVHPNTDLEYGIWASSGSLGHGIGIAVGMAIANAQRAVYCLMSDGELSEGSVWESLRLASRLQLMNLKVTVNANGYGAYSKLDVEWLKRRFNFFPVSFRKVGMEGWPPYIQGQAAHYHVLSDNEYREMSLHE